MKAIVYQKYGSPEVLQIREIKKPVPKENEVLIKVRATTVTRYDCWARSCKAHTGLEFLMRIWFGIKKPRQPVLGTELAGDIASTGKNVKRLKSGDPVFAYSAMTLGAYAEYISLPERVVVEKPRNLNYIEAASVLQGGLTAHYFLRLAKIRKGQKILIIGASGGVGMYAVQLAKHYFNAEVTGICSTSKKDMVKALGAYRVIDYIKEDYRKEDILYDIIFDTFGMSSFSSSKVLKKNGSFLFATYGLRQVIHILWLNIATSKKAISPILKESTEDIILIKSLIDEGKIKPVIDKVFSMKEVVEAHRYFEDGKKTGHVVIAME